MPSRDNQNLVDTSVYYQLCNLCNANMQNLVTATKFTHANQCLVALALCLGSTTIFLITTSKRHQLSLA